MHWDPAIGLPLLILSFVALLAIYIIGRKRPPAATRNETERAESARIEPSFGDAALDTDPAAARVKVPAETGKSGVRPMPPQAPLAHAAAVAPITPASATPAKSAGKRQEANIERIISLFVTAREGRVFRGVDLVVAAEKVGLEFGDMNIFHRLDERSVALGPVFSVANMVKPGNFDLARIDALLTPGLGFFMTLPGPLNALDAWDAMLPAAQRMAELLDGVLLDSERNGLGRQGIQHIRDDLRNWDRRHEGEEIGLRGR